MKLKELQETLSSALQGDDEAITTCLPHIHSDALSAERRFQIYQDSIFSGRLNNLIEIYANCVQLVGEEFFSALGTRYLQQQPSQHWDYACDTQSFIDFIAKEKAVAELPYLQDIASLDWSWHRAHYEEEGRGIDYALLATLTEIQQQGLQFHRSPHTQLIRSSYPIFKIWSLCQPNSDDPEISNLDDPESIVVWRQDSTVQLQKLCEEDASFLEHLLTNDSFVVACEKHLANTPDYDITTTLPLFLSHTWFSHFTIREDDESSM